MKCEAEFLKRTYARERLKPSLWSTTEPSENVCLTQYLLHWLLDRDLSVQLKLAQNPDKANIDRVDRFYHVSW